jgi:hypothetical protein
MLKTITFLLDSKANCPTQGDVGQTHGFGGVYVRNLHDDLCGPDLVTAGIVLEAAATHLDCKNSVSEEDLN